MSTAVLHRDGLTITTQLFPQQTVPGTYGPAVTSQPLLPNFEIFFRGQPKALGKAQIVIGSLALLFGFVLTIMLNWAPYNPSEVHDNCQKSLFMLWGPITHIIVGCLGFVQEKRLSGCGVKTILVMNVISAVTGGICIILLLCLLFQQPNGYTSYELPVQASYLNTASIPMTALSSSEVHVFGVIGMLLVLSVLQIIISIIISVFAYKAVYSAAPTEKHAQASNLNTASIPMTALSNSEDIYETPDVEEHPAAQPAGSTEQKKTLYANGNDSKTSKK